MYITKFYEKRDEPQFSFFRERQDKSNYFYLLFLFTFHERQLEQTHHRVH
jgi:hypothetical protein